MSGDILTLNAGSSSLKFAVFEAGRRDRTARINGNFAGIGGIPRFSAHDAEGRPLDGGDLSNLTNKATHDDVISLLLDWLARHQGDRPLLAVGHRVVHGGQTFSEPVHISDSVIKDLEALVPLAPLHQPHNLSAIRTVAAWRPDLRQIACFDTGFHRTQDRLATLFALPRALTDEGVIRYGFHGLSYDYIASILPDQLGPRADGRVVVAHLGNGASLCAMKNRKSLATSMGFTALEGLVMGQRSGSLDPGVLLYLMQSKGMGASEIEDLLYRQSGLFGVSGISNNMRVLDESDAPEAAEAIALFAYRAASILAGLLPALGGLDALVFTAGIGENSARARQEICDYLGWLGVEVDRVANERNAVRISTDASALEVLVLPTNEEAVIAAACRDLLERGPAH